jgi:rhodanese-related sulfurtransferase
MSKHKKKIQPKSQKSNKSNVWMWAALAVVLLIVTGGFLFNEINGSTAKIASLPAEVSIARAGELREAGAFMLDVREPMEWDEFHMPGATLIPLGQLASRVNELPKDQEIVVVCRSGNRSQEGRDILLRAGFENVTSMSGGMIQWRSMGLPTVP